MAGTGVGSGGRERVFAGPELWPAPVQGPAHPGHPAGQGRVVFLLPGTAGVVLAQARGGSGRSFVDKCRRTHGCCRALGRQGSGCTTRPGVLRAATQHGSLAHVSYHRPLLCPRGLSVLRDPFPEALGASSGRCHGNHLTSAHTGGLSAASEPEVLLTRVDSRFPGAEVL